MDQFACYSENTLTLSSLRLYILLCIVAAVFADVCYVIWATGFIIIIIHEFHGDTSLKQNFRAAVNVTYIRLVSMLLLPLVCVVVRSAKQFRLQCTLLVWSFPDLCLDVDTSQEKIYKSRSLHASYSLGVGLLKVSLQNPSLVTREILFDKKTAQLTDHAGIKMSLKSVRF